MALRPRVTAWQPDSAAAGCDAREDCNDVRDTVNLSHDMLGVGGHAASQRSCSEQAIWLAGHGFMPMLSASTPS